MGGGGWPLAALAAPLAAPILRQNLSRGRISKIREGGSDDIWELRVADPGPSRGLVRDELKCWPWGRSHRWLAGF